MQSFTSVTTVVTSSPRSTMQAFRCSAAAKKMRELIPNTVEASGEKHLPVAERSGSTLTVTVGAVEHPMVDVHHIQWLYVETAQGGHIRYLHPGEAPRAAFELGDETPVAVYAYCNLHGLWTTKL